MEDTELIYGKNPVLEVIKFRRLHKLWLTENAFQKMRPRVNRALLQMVSKSELTHIAGRPDHQGAVALVDKYRLVSSESLFSLQSGVVLALDGITDPRNLGAIIRSAVLLGAKGIIIPEKGSSEITPVVCHASAGGTERIAVASVESILHAINVFKSHGFISACAELPGEGSVFIDDFEPPEKLLLTMGSEEGLRKRVRLASDYILSIPQCTDFDSFNVSVAASIMLWEFYKKGRRGRP